MVVSPIQSSTQGSQDISEQSPLPSTRGRKNQRNHREQEAQRELELGRKNSIEETNLLQNVRNVERARIDSRFRAGPQPARK